ncbi:MAG: bifunctional folylpolyglutamate synthase/dihydrofolate synthase [Flavobacteriales bacterium]|jgi:dihydrofolate synthase/folylpolyglutamate synthase
MKSYEEVLDYLYSALPMFHRVGPAAYKPDLSNTLALCEIIGNPHKGLKTVHIAGTNGKGSTSHLIASSLQEAGYKVGLCTSPHLKDFRERIKINGRMITREAVVDFVEKYRQHWTSIEPSFFEMTIALSFWYFKNENVDIAVIETGLGGRLDSTNVIQPEVCAITNIGWDHMNLLGDSLEKIAIEKAGIIKPNTPVVLGEMKPNVRSVILQKANEHSVEWIDASLETEEPPSSELKGYYQDQNRRTAYQTLLTLRKKGWNIGDDHISNGFTKVIQNTGLMGRWQVLGHAPLTVADVGHNVDGIEILMKQVNDQAFEKLHFVIGMVNDKDIQSVLKLLPKDAHYYFCKADIPRGLEASLLQEQALLQGLKGDTYPSVRSAFKTAKEKASEKDMILIGGSVFTVAEVL